MQPALSYSLVVPVYRNEANIPALLAAIAGLHRELGPSFEAIFVVDGSPDASHERLQQALPAQPFASTLVALARNFGAFAAIRHGLGMARGRQIAVMAADLQEPPALVVELLRRVEGGADVAFGTREGRNDPALSRALSNAYWSLYRRWVMPDIPRGGVDIFAVSQRVRDALLTLPEANTSLLAQLFWLGGRRAFVPYVRQQREIGRSAWTFRKKLRYLMDSVFAFTDLPIRVLFGLGLMGVTVSAVLALVVLAAKLSGHVAVPGYAATILVVLFFGAFNALGLGIIGSYVWRAFENTKQRPLTIEQQAEAFTPDSLP
ncbi:MAG TPA: glycosyltransferase family 2 protein [Pseudoxanthomonas sp.]|jgi:glycosyltransferase involved in cell wall biosynthesis|uniref:glycosyltransferase family 2 protein n=1 Tax=Thermomonas sp. LB-4 TaxID=3102790 RepID=UPI002ED98FDD